MSYTERHIGKVKMISSNKVFIEDWCKSKCEELGIEPGDYYEGYKDALLSEAYPAVAVEVDGVLWEIIDEEEDADDNLSVFTPVSDGVYNYVVQFYNGGTYLGEMLEEGIQKLKEGKQ